MSDISLALEEEVVDVLLNELGYRIQPWEAEEIAHKLVEIINERLSFAIDG